MCSECNWPLPEKTKVQLEMERMIDEYIETPSKFLKPLPQDIHNAKILEELADE